MTTIYLDECGYTGEDLLNKEQPLFVLASLACDENTAKAIKDKFFAKFQGPSLKHSALKKKSKNHESIRDFLANIGGESDIKTIVRFAVKRFVASGKMVDLLVEPTMFADGLDLYERGGNMAMSNMIYMVAPLAIGDAKFQRILDLFVKAVRTRQKHFYDSMMEEIDSAIRKSPHPEMASDCLSFYQIAHARQGYAELIQDLPENALDVSLSFALDISAEWRKIINKDEDIVIVHDKSSNMAKQEHIWKALISPDMPPALVGYDRRTQQFPIGINDVSFGSDEQLVGIQLADILAGSIAAGMYWLLVERSPGDKYGQMMGEVLKERILDLRIDGIFPSRDVTPQDLGTDGPKHGDLLLYTGNAIRQAKERKGK